MIQIQYIRKVQNVQNFKHEKVKKIRFNFIPFINTSFFPKKICFRSIHVAKNIDSIEQLVEYFLVPAVRPVQFFLAPAVRRIYFFLANAIFSRIFAFCDRYVTTGSLTSKLSIFFKHTCWEYIKIPNTAIDPQRRVTY